MDVKGGGPLRLRGALAQRKDEQELKRARLLAIVPATATFARPAFGT